MAGLIAQWREDRGRATIIQLGNFERGIASIAAPDRDLSGGVVAAISATRAFATDEDIDPAVRDSVHQCARRISTLLGGR